VATGARWPQVTTFFGAMAGACLSAFVACSSSSNTAPTPPGEGGSTADAATDATSAVGASDGAVQAVNGCTEADFAANDHTAATDPRVIAAPTVAAPAQFTPHCMRVKVDQLITWSGDLADHPVDFMVIVPRDVDAGPDASIAAIVGAPDGAATMDTLKVPFPATVAFNCSNHPKVMFGAVEVVP
jgi:hypothetical protein